MLADLTGKALKGLGLNNDISAGDDYAAPMAWALAIHEHAKKWDGILYVSRQSQRPHGCRVIRAKRRHQGTVAQA